MLILTLVFCGKADISESDTRFVSTLKRILKTPERGGLTSNVSPIPNSPTTLIDGQNLVYRYDVNKSDDGVGGEEGTFCLCTLWCVEALTRAGEYDKPLLRRAVEMFEVCLILHACIKVVLTG